MRKYFCWLFGHRLMLVFDQKSFKEDGQLFSQYTGWKCMHCPHTDTVGWDG